MKGDQSKLTNAHSKSAVSTGSMSISDGAGGDYTKLFKEVNKKFDNNFNLKSKAFIPTKKTYSLNGDMPNPQQTTI
jgi:hypothetical protein